MVMPVIPGSSSHAGGRPTASEPPFTGWRPTMLKPLRMQVLRSLRQPPRRLPQKLEEGADEFDLKLRNEAEHAHRMELWVRKEPFAPEASPGFTQAVEELSRSRFVIREQLEGYQAIKAGKHDAADAQRLLELEEQLKE